MMDYRVLRDTMDKREVLVCPVAPATRDLLAKREKREPQDLMDQRDPSDPLDTQDHRDQRDRRVTPVCPVMAFKDLREMLAYLGKCNDSFNSPSTQSSPTVEPSPVLTFLH